MLKQPAKPRDLNKLASAIVGEATAEVRVINFPHEKFAQVLPEMSKSRTTQETGSRSNSK